MRTPFVARFIATFGYAGFFPWAPATLASLIVAGIYFFLPPLNLVVQAVLLGVVSWIGIVTASMTEKELGLDAGPIVIDEVAGMIVTYFMLPPMLDPYSRFLVLGAGFVFFRFFDIVKPWPADKLQNLHGGTGIVADDLMAGLYSNIAVRLLLVLGFPGWFPGVTS